MVSPNTCDNTYQSNFAVEGLENDEQLNNTPEFNRFVDILAQHGFIKLTVGYATESDECRLRHVSAEVRDANGEVHEDLDPDCTAWPSDFQLDESKLYDCLDWCDVEYLNTIHVGKRTIEQGPALYITEPTLVDSDGDEVRWNYYS